MNRCITLVSTPHIINLYILHNTCVGYTPVHADFYTCNTYICRLYACITCVKHVYYRCSTCILQVYEWHVSYTKTPYVYCICHSRGKVPILAYTQTIVVSPRYVPSLMQHRSGFVAGLFLYMYMALWFVYTHISKGIVTMHKTCMIYYFDMQKVRNIERV